ncbi:hypothetical protein ACFE04_028575 [Oxalis oulophora]
MPVAFRLQPVNKMRYTVKPQSGIIAPLSTLTVEIIYHLQPGYSLPECYPHCKDSFLLHSIVVPGAAPDVVPNDWFTTKKKQVFIDSGIKVMFVGSVILAQLVMESNMDEIREVLDCSDPSWKSANSVDSEGNSLLHIAISQGLAYIVQLLLEFKPDVEFQSKLGFSPIEAAARSGEALIVELLLARKASTERAESSISGPIHISAANGHLEVLRLGAKPNIRNAADGDTPLHIAAGLGDEPMVKLLLHKGANKDIRNKLGKTAYDLAAEFGHTRLFDSLKLGDSLCTAARKGELRTIQKLIENGASINGRDQNEWTALHRAAFKGRIEAARLLIERGIDVNAKDEDGYAALHCAVESGQIDVIELLVKKGADVEARTNKGVSALQITESLHYVGITRLLIHGGAVGGMPVNGKQGERKGLVKKKKAPRPRGLRSSFDRSMPLAVV